MNKHTPGPWIAKDGGRFDPEINITTESRHEANMHRICGIDIGFTGEFGVEQKANVHLIAAAPDLLEALTRLLQMCDWLRLPGQPKSDSMKNAEAAIAKATGETP